MCVDLFVAEGDQRENGVADAGFLGRGSMRGARCFPSRGDANLILQLNDDALCGLLADPLDLGKRGNVAGHDTCFEGRHGCPAENIERSFGADPTHVTNEESEEIALRPTHKAIEHVGVFADREMREDLELRSDRRQFVVTREGNEHMISNTANIHDDLRRQRFRESAGEMVNHGPVGSSDVGRRARKNRAWLWLLFLAALLAVPMQLRAEEPWFLLPEPKFMKAPVAKTIPNARQTVLAVVRMTAYGLEYAKAEQSATLNISDAALTAQTQAEAAKWLQTATPEYKRNAKKVIEYGVLHSESVPLAATVFAPEFWRKFEEVFGAKMRVVIPNRHTVFLFPDVAKDLQPYAPLIIEAWRSDYPKASLEVFEVTERGVRAIGDFEEP